METIYLQQIEAKIQEHCDSIRGKISGGSADSDPEIQLLRGEIARLEVEKEKQWQRQEAEKQRQEAEKQRNFTLLLELAKATDEKLKGFIEAQLTSNQHVLGKRKREEEQEEESAGEEEQMVRRRSWIEKVMSTPSNSNQRMMLRVQGAALGPAIKNLRCSDPQAPMVLFDRTLGTFRKHCQERQPTADDICAMTRLAIEVGTVYMKNEDTEYTPAVDWIMMDFLGRPHPRTGRELVYRRIETGPSMLERSDGGILHRRCPLLFVENKPAPDDTFEHQVVRYYDRYCSWMERESIAPFDWSYMPCLTITFTGAMMRIGGVVRGAIAIAEPFETIDMLNLWAHQPGRMRRAAAVLGTVYETLHHLAADYERMAAPQLSIRKKRLNREIPVALHDLARFREVRSLRRRAQVFTYEDEKGSKCVAKIIRGTVGGEVHECWAKAGLAPVLVADPEVIADDLDGPLTLLLMEFLGEGAGWRFPREIMGDEKQGAKQAALDAIKRAHLLTLPDGTTTVHGDARACNFMLRADPGRPGEWQVKFLDFDWSGKAGVARYPLPLNRNGIKWPDGAQWNELITTVHDEWHVEHAFDDDE